MIVLRFETVDHIDETKEFETIEEAREYAHEKVTPTPEISLMFNYAVSPCGVAKISPEVGTTMRELFPDSSDARPETW